MYLADRPKPYIVTTKYTLICLWSAAADPKHSKFMSIKKQTKHCHALCLSQIYGPLTCIPNATIINNCSKQPKLSIKMNPSEVKLRSLKLHFCYDQQNAPSPK